MNGETGTRYLCWPRGEIVVAYMRINNNKNRDVFENMPLSFFCKKKLRKANTLINKVVNFKKIETTQIL